MRICLSNEWMIVKLQYHCERITQKHLNISLSSFKGDILGVGGYQRLSARLKIDTCALCFGMLNIIYSWW